MLTGPAISSVGLPLDGAFSFEENRRPRVARVSPVTLGKECGMQPHQIRQLIRSQMNRSLVDFGRHDFTREELVLLASSDERLLEDTLSEWERAGYLERTKDGAFYIRVHRPIEVTVPGWPTDEKEA